MQQRFSQTLVQARPFRVRSMSGQQVGAEHQEQADKKNHEGEQHRLHLLKEDSWQLQSAGFESFCKTRTNTSWTKATDYLSLRINTGPLVLENLLHRDRLAFHSGNFGNRSYAPAAVGKTRNLDHEIDRGGNLLAHRAIGKPHARHLNHRFQAGQRVTWGVCVDSRQTAILAGVHRVQHVDCLAATNLAEHNAIGTHAQRVANQISLRYFTFALDVWWSGLETDDVWLLQLQFG